MAVANITGLASGIEWKDTVDALMQIEYQPMERLLERKEAIDRKSDAWNNVTSKLEAFQSAATRIDELKEVLENKATSSDTNSVLATAGATALPGTHEVEVNQLAQNEVFVHDVGWHDLNSTSLTSTGGTFAYNYDGTEYTVSVAAGTTMEGLINLINSDENNPGITASAIDDGGAAQPIHLVLSVNEADSADKLSSSATTDIGEGVSFDGAGDWVTSQNAQQAEVRVDGYPTAGWITRNSNELTDVIPGVTLTLKEATTPDTVTVTVEKDYAAIKQNIKDWVTAYNEVVETISTYTRYDTENEIRGVLMGDSQVNRVRDELVRMVSSKVPGIDDTADFQALVDVGMELASGSKLTVDDTDLQEALEQDADAVAELFIFTEATTNSAIQYFSRTDATQGGDYEVQVSYKADGSIDATGTNTIGGYAASVEAGRYLLGKEGTPVDGLRVRFVDPGGGPGTATGTVSVGTGYAVMTDSKVETWTDRFDGIITNVQESYDLQIENLEEQMLSLERRLEIKRQMLEKQFLAMEQAVSEARAQSNWTAGL